MGVVVEGDKTIRCLSFILSFIWVNSDSKPYSGAVKVLVFIATGN